MFHPVKRGAGRKHTGIFTAVILWVKADTNQTDNEELASMNADSYVTLEHTVEAAANGQPARSAPARQEVTLHTSRWQQSVFSTLKGKPEDWGNRCWDKAPLTHVSHPKTVSWYPDVVVKISTYWRIDEDWEEPSACALVFSRLFTVFTCVPLLDQWFIPLSTASSADTARHPTTGTLGFTCSLFEDI